MQTIHFQTCEKTLHSSLCHSLSNVVLLKPDRRTGWLCVFFSSARHSSCTRGCPVCMRNSVYDGELFGKWGYSNAKSRDPTSVNCKTVKKNSAGKHSRDNKVHSVFRCRQESIVKVRDALRGCPVCERLLYWGGGGGGGLAFFVSLSPWGLRAFLLYVHVKVCL